MQNKNRILKSSDILKGNRGKTETELKAERKNGNYKSWAKGTKNKKCFSDKIGNLAEELSENRKE